MAGDAGLRAACLSGVETVPCMAGVALGGHRVALDTGLDFGLGFVYEVGGIHRTLHCQHMAGKAKAGFILEFAVLFFVATAADVRGGQSKLLMVIAVTIAAIDRFLALGMAACTPVGDDAGGNPFMTLDAQRSLEHAFHYPA